MSTDFFIRNLVKGKIVETIFAQMLRDTNKFTVLEFGYEKVIPDFIQNGYREKSPMINTLRSAPDFAVINREKRTVKLIEVKYRHAMDAKEILKIAKRMSESWNPSYLFVATDDCFYFDEIQTVIKHKGEISKMVHDFIPSELQVRYLNILRDFENPNTTYARSNS